jgi:hypothetical protein
MTRPSGLLGQQGKRDKARDGRRHLQLVDTA